MRYAKCLSLFTTVRSFATLACYIVGNVYAADPSHNFGHLYKWRNTREGFEEAKLTRKPIFLLVHKPDCPTCEQLKPKFTNSIRILDLSQHFVMVDVKKDQDPAADEARFQPDGTYVPRILFFTPDGEFMEDIYNRHPKANNSYKYFYSNTSQIVDSMILALERLKESKGSYKPKLS